MDTARAVRGENTSGKSDKVPNAAAENGRDSIGVAVVVLEGCASGTSILARPARFPVDATGFARFEQA